MGTSGRQQKMKALIQCHILAEMLSTHAHLLAGIFPLTFRSSGPSLLKVQLTRTCLDPGRNLIRCMTSQGLHICSIVLVWLYIQNGLHHSVQGLLPDHIYTHGTDPGMIRWTISDVSINAEKSKKEAEVHQNKHLSIQNQYLCFQNRLSRSDLQESTEERSRFAY